MKPNDLIALARAAGIETRWRDVRGNDHVVSDDSLKAVLNALGLPAETDSQILESIGELRREAESGPRPLITAQIGSAIAIAAKTGRYRVTLQSGARVEGFALADAGGIILPGIQEPGYHRLELDGAVCTLAVAPRRGYTLRDVAKGKKLWGLPVQLYALRGKNGGAVSDFAALAAFARAAARQRGEPQ